MLRERGRERILLREKRQIYAQSERERVFAPRAREGEKARRAKVRVGMNTPKNKQEMCRFDSHVLSSFQRP